MSNRSLDDDEPAKADGDEHAGDASVGPHAPPRALSGTLRAEDPAFEALLREVAAASPAPPPLPRPGDIIAGKYRIEQKLGQGGMGVVFRATHLISDKQVAIKWMLHTAQSENARGRFVREARAAARIDHPNVVDVYDIGQDGDRGLYLVMQLLRGESLADRIARGPLPIVEAVDLLLPAMRGVAAVHAAGVIHRDLKPDNIFLCEPRHGERGEAKVLDFGISAVAATGGVDVALTRSGAVLGTPAYMSSEQIADSRSVDARTDVYAFGVILYEAFTGQLPFQAKSQHELVMAIVGGGAKDPRQLRPELPENLSKAVLRALEKQREDRYQDVESLIQALAPHGSLRESQANLPLPEVAPPVAVQAPRKPWWLVLLLLTASLLALAYWLTRVRPPSASGAQSPYSVQNK